MVKLNKLSWKNLRLLAKHHLTDQPVNYPEQDKDLGIISLGLNLGDFYKKLLTFKNLFDIRKVEEVSYRKGKYPVYEIEVNKHAKKKLFILSGTHGNEHAGILAILDLLKDIRDNPEFYERIRLLIFTPHNPVGTKCFSRFNGQGVDLNRDFKKRRTAETRAVIASMKKFDQDFTLSLHEGPQEKGTFIYCNKLVTKGFALSVLNYAKEKGVTLADRNYFSGKLKVPGYFPLKGFVFFLEWLWSVILDLQPEGYYTNINGIPNITVETPWQNRSKRERILAQISIIKGVVKELSRG